MPVSSEQALFESTPKTVKKAILCTVAYADVFDYPLTGAQVHRYLVGTTASPSAVRNALDSERLVPRQLSRINDYYCLAGREAVVQTRLHRAAISAHLWPKARRYGRSIASLPFVRMVAITGTIAVDNADSDADIDYLIATAPRRVWLARSFVIALVYRARLEHIEICPNFVISTDALDQFERSLFSAHELAQMVPIYGLDVYDRLIRANRWARVYLPNAFGPNATNPKATGQETPRSSALEAQDRASRPRVSRIQQTLKQTAEVVLQGRLGDFIEDREGKRKISQLNAEADCARTCAAAFTPQRCKGHMDDHGSKIEQAYARRLERLGIDPQETWANPSAAPSGRMALIKDG